MSRSTRALLAAAGLVAASAAAALAGEPATTTRIETRAFYGATVTLEEGVRVFRPLPPHQRIIINPGAKASVSLGFEEHVNKHYNHNGSGSATAADASGHAASGSPAYAGSVAHGAFAHGKRGHAPGGQPVVNRGHGKGHQAGQGHPSGKGSH